MSIEPSTKCRRVIFGFPLTTQSSGCNGKSSSSKTKQEKSIYSPPSPPPPPRHSPPSDVEMQKIEDGDDGISLPDVVSQKNIWNYSKRDILNYVLKILAAIEILYSGFTVMVILALKIYKGSDDRTRLSKTKLTLDEIQYHLRGLGLRFVNVVDLGSVEAFVAGAMWFMFALGILLHILHVAMGINFFRGLQTGDPKKLKSWMYFGGAILVLDILFFPLIVAICANAGHIAGIWPLCQPSGSKWLHIFFKVVFYSSILLTYVLRRDILADSRKIENYKLNLIDIRS